jgi:adenylate cyclase
LRFSRFRTSLRSKIGALLLILSLGPFLVVDTLGIVFIAFRLRQFSQRIENTEMALRTDVVGKNLKGAASDTAVEIDNAFLRMLADLRHWGEEDIVVEAAQAEDQTAQRLFRPGTTEALISSTLKGHFTVPIPPPLFKAAASYLFRQSERPDSNVAEILVTGRNGYNAVLTRAVAQIDHHEEAWWSAAASADGAGIGTQEAFLDLNAKATLFGIALPVTDTKSGDVMGVIRGFFRLDEIQKALSQKAVSLNADIRVVDRRGQLLADTASNHSATVVLNRSQESWKPGDAASLAIKAPPGPNGAGFLTQRGQIVGYAHTYGSAFFEVRGFRRFSGFEWGVLVSQPEERALRVLHPLMSTASQFQKLPFYLAGLTAAVMALVVVLASVASLLVSRGISSPLVALSHEALRVQKGDLSARVEIKSEDEVGVLGKAFNTMTEGLREREREREVFGRVVSPEVREKLLSGQLALGGETRRVSVLFSDVRGFSTMAETTSPNETVTFLNEYLTEMSEAIRPWGGYINNFIGDAIFVIFGAPLDLAEPELHSVRAAVTMRERLAELNRRRLERGLKVIKSGVGISTGEVVAGQIGSMERLQYTVIGDAVNVAARLETLTKELPDFPILINEATADALKGNAEIGLKALGPYQVKGRTEPVQVSAVVWQRKRDGTQVFVV